MIEAYKKFWKGYDDFRGRSTPSDYWFAYSAHVLIFFASYLLLAVFQGMAVDETSLLRNEVIFLFIFFVYGVAAILPGIAITVRRLRDAGCNWLYIFIPLIPFVGIFILIFLLCQPTEVEVPLNNVDNPQQ